MCDNLVDCMACLHSLASTNGLLMFVGKMTRYSLDAENASKCEWLMSLSWCYLSCMDESMLCFVHVLALISFILIRYLIEFVGWCKCCMPTVMPLLLICAFFLIIFCLPLTAKNSVNTSFVGRCCFFQNWVEEEEEIYLAETVMTVTTEHLYDWLERRQWWVSVIFRESNVIHTKTRTKI